jgi:hypothetical protein
VCSPVQAAKGIVLPIADLIIGAGALELGYAVGTANLREFKRIPGLQLFRSERERPTGLPIPVIFVCRDKYLEAFSFGGFKQGSVPARRSAEHVARAHAAPARLCRSLSRARNNRHALALQRLQCFPLQPLADVFDGIGVVLEQNAVLTEICLHTFGHKGAELRAPPAIVQPP